MPLSLILFFISLLGITFMVGHKLVLIRNGNGETVKVMHAHPFVPELQKIKKITSKGAKRLGYILLFIILRFFIKSSNFIKIKSIEITRKIKARFKKNKNGLSEAKEKKEGSKYLKAISEYRQKIRKMKHIIKEEEGIE